VDLIYGQLPLPAITRAHDREAQVKAGRDDSNERDRRICRTISPATTATSVSLTCNVLLSH
jgi:hypothetical protein